jgi:hypothetical protein
MLHECYKSVTKVLRATRVLQVCYTCVVVIQECYTCVPRLVRLRFAGRWSRGEHPAASDPVLISNLIAVYCQKILMSTGGDCCGCTKKEKKENSHESLGRNENVPRSNAHVTGSTENLIHSSTCLQKRDQRVSDKGKLRNCTQNPRCGNRRNDNFSIVT